MKRSPTKEDIDKAVDERDVPRLVDLIRLEGLDVETRSHLASTIEGLLTKKIRFPRRRPKGSAVWDKHEIALRVWDLLNNAGWEKTEAAVKRVSEEKGCSEGTVWKSWMAFDRIAYAIMRQNESLEAMLDAAHAEAYDAAVEHLAQTQGWFTEEDIHAVMEAIEADAAAYWEGFDDY